MICPYCGSDQSTVLDSRQGEQSRRRRYACPSCQQRFSTIETVDTLGVPLDKRIIEERKEAERLQQLLRDGEKRVDRILKLLELEEKWMKQ